MHASTAGEPLYIVMDERDNVAIVANDGGLPAGTRFPSGLTLVDKVPQGHKVALVDLAAGDPVRRYNVTIGRAARAIAAGSWVHERLLEMPAARSLEGLPISTVKASVPPPLEGFTFEGYRNADGSVGSRNILAITTTVQCVAGVVEFAVKRIKDELLPKYPHVDDVVGLEHTYGCGVAIDAPDAVIPIRTLRNITRNPNFGNEVMVVSLGCEKLQPERLLPPGTFAMAAPSAQAASFRASDPERKRRPLGATGKGRRGRRRRHERAEARRRVPAGRRACGLHVDDRLDHGHGGSAPRTLEPPPPRNRAGERARGRRAMRRQRRVQRRHRQSRGGLLHRSAGACGRDRHVLRDHRSARRHRPADGAGRDTRGRRRDDPRDGLVRRVPRQGPRRPQRQHDAGQQEGRPLQHRREGDGLDREERQRADLGRAVAGRETERPGHHQGPGLCRHAGQRLHLRHAAARGRHQPARVHDRAAARRMAWPKCR